ncbi:TIM-barrel domain-containing protein [Psychroflexus halocasei]|uniref:Alpha-glucosidase/oligosaccharide 4-alpha-D-glucosyltransferase n=1 Tax=Psychroflexus halocasei TaxID=908615 RepID=A0A1H3WW89_9FLAO|nr:TIM-barrel domain-containing protein [Psychroflexus halocasei]SDZ91437.1 alpha-glucosidase/oligosaccharide 4-alpha-D-glucosyltransferase [Psychroflexus halocasei]
MKPTFFSFFLVFVLCGLNLTAQNPDRIFQDIQMQDDAIIIQTSDGNYQMSYLLPDIVETEFIPEGSSSISESHAVQLKERSSDFTISKNDNSVEIHSEGIEINIQKSPFQITYFYDSEKLISEKNGYQESDVGFEIDFNLNESETLMGGGARALGMNRRGHRLKLYNRAHYGYESKSELMNYSMPIAISSKKYMIHFDNPSTSYLDFDSQFNNRLAYEAISGAKKYQVIAGNSWEKIIENYTALTGRQKLPPRWALGNFASRFGYHSQKETLETIDQFRKENIPVDAVILDLYWFGKTVQGTMGNLAFDKDSFPKPKKMIKKLKRNNVETVLITEPFILTTSNRWDEAVRADILAKDTLENPATYDFYFGNTGLIDVFKPEAKQWFWEIYDGLKNKGVNGWWGDLGEPEVHPDYLQHHKAKAHEVHNIYGHQWAKIISEGYRKNYPDERPFILMRAGYSGSQKYGMIPWSGDVNRTWGGLEPQPEIALQMSLQGLAYMHSDLGGFAGNLNDDDLYVRWLQYGVFQPIYRPHAQEEVPSEPIFRSEKAKNLSRKAIELRYQLLPYNYQLAFENQQKGLPLMRPLFFEEPENASLYNVSETYLWGNDFLISPVLKPHLISKEVYFPQTSNWIDYYTGEVHQAGETKEIQLKESHIPTFVRAGSFILKTPLIQSTKEYVFNDLDLEFYHDSDVEKSHRSFYNDNGKLQDAFAKKAYEKLNLKYKKIDNNSFQIQINHEVGEAFKSDLQKINLNIKNISKKPETISINGKKHKFHFDEKAQVIKINSISINNTNTLIQIK